jgi:hypothetical protein
VRQTIVLGLCVLLGALLVATAVVSLNAHVRALSDDVAALARELTAIAEDVRSLADDVAALTDALTAEDGAAGGDGTCPSDVGGVGERRSRMARVQECRSATVRSAPPSRRRSRGNGSRP